jgi:hypothetical protein
MRNKLLLVFFGLFLLLPAVSMLGQRAAKDEGWSELLPPGEGKDLVLTSCTNCHNLKVVVHARKSRPDWDKSINDMIQRSAPIFAEEIEPISVYLTTSFGPDVPRLVNANIATQNDLQTLPDLKPETAGRILEIQKAGPFKNGEEFRQALGMEKSEFEKIRYFFKYSN